MKKSLVATAIASALAAQTANAGVVVYGKIHASIDYLDSSRFESSGFTEESYSYNLPASNCIQLVVFLKLEQYCKSLVKIVLRIFLQYLTINLYSSDRKTIFYICKAYAKIGNKILFYSLAWLL